MNKWIHRIWKPLMACVILASSVMQFHHHHQPCAKHPEKVPFICIFHKFDTADAENFARAHKSDSNSDHNCALHLNKVYREQDSLADLSKLFLDYAMGVLPETGISTFLKEADKANVETNRFLIPRKLFHRRFLRAPPIGDIQIS